MYRYDVRWWGGHGFAYQGETSGFWGAVIATTSRCMGPKTRPVRGNLFERKARVMLLAFMPAYWRGITSMPNRRHRSFLWVGAYRCPLLRYARSCEYLFRRCHSANPVDAHCALTGWRPGPIRGWLCHKLVVCPNQFFYSFSLNGSLSCWKPSTNLRGTAVAAEGNSSIPGAETLFKWGMKYRMRW